jgi:hypothetical protein
MSAINSFSQGSAHLYTWRAILTAARRRSDAPDGVAEIACQCHRIIMTNLFGTIAVDRVGVGLAAFGMLKPGLPRVDSCDVRVGIHSEFSPSGGNPANDVSQGS